MQTTTTKMLSLRWIIALQLIFAGYCLPFSVWGEGSPENEASYKQANLLLDQGKTQEACNILQELVNNNPQNFAYTHDLAVALEQLGDKDKALSYFKTAVKLSPDSGAAHYSLGRFYELEDNNLEQAIGEYQMALAIDPNNFPAHNNLGVIYSKQGKYPESVTEFQAALKTAANYPLAQRNLGYAQAHTSLGISYFRQGQIETAFKEYEQALQIDPEYADAYYNLALLYQKQNQLQDAIRFYQIGLQYDPKNVKAYNNLGVAFHKLGRNDLAAEQYRQALSIKPDFKEAKDNLEVLTNK